MSLRTPIARARGLGPGHAGIHHWTVQRLTAISNVPLVLWFIFSAVALSGAGYAETVEWLASPISATLMILLVISVFYHAKLGVQVIIEDYVHYHGARVAALAALTLVMFGLATACIVSVLRVSLGILPMPTLEG